MFKHSDTHIQHKEELSFQEACAHVSEEAWHLALYFNSELFRESIRLQKSRSRLPLDAISSQRAFNCRSCRWRLATGRRRAVQNRAWYNDEVRGMTECWQMPLRDKHMCFPPKNLLKQCQIPKSCQEKLWSTLGVSHISDCNHIFIIHKIINKSFIWYSHACTAVQRMWNTHAQWHTCLQLAIE